MIRTAGNMTHIRPDVVSHLGAVFVRPARPTWRADRSSIARRAIEDSGLSRFLIVYSIAARQHLSLSTSFRQSGSRSALPSYGVGRRRRGIQPFEPPGGWASWRMRSSGHTPTSVTWIGGGKPISPCGGWSCAGIVNSQRRNIPIEQLGRRSAPSGGGRNNRLESQKRSDFFSPPLPKGDGATIMQLPYHSAGTPLGLLPHPTL